MGITIKCGESIELVQKVLEEIERRMPDMLWAAGELPTSYNPKRADDGEHVALFVNDYGLTYVKNSEECVEDYISSNHVNNNIIYAEDFIAGETAEDIQNEMSVSFLFN